VPDVTVVPEGAIEIQPGDLVRKGQYEEKVYLFDWDRYKLATDVIIEESTFTVTTLRPGGVVNVTTDNESILSGERKTWLRIMDGTVGDLYTVSNRVTTNENPSQTFEVSFELLIEQG
jgi:hypothetical protein